MPRLQRKKTRVADEARFTTVAADSKMPAPRTPLNLRDATPGRCRPAANPCRPLEPAPLTVVPSRRLVVVSNRLPDPSGAVSVGGLVSGLCAALRGTGALWFGWSGQVSDNWNGDCRFHDFGSFACASIDLTHNELAGYYEGFANRVLWPWFHGRADLMAYDVRQFSVYRAVNRKFAKAMVGELSRNDLVWIHDFHLIPLGRSLRRLGVDAPLGFFLHVPFPSPADVATLPCHLELVHDLFQYDLVGFQTVEDQRNFQDYVVRYMDGAMASDGSVFVGGKRFKTGVFPIGIDGRAFGEMAASEVASLKDRMSRRGHADGSVIGVDRLDYTKGLVHRMRGFERFLDSATPYRGRTRLLQIAAPSRENVPEYRDLKIRVGAEARRINSRFARSDWTPILYLNRSFEPAQLAALYRVSRVALVTPLRDGMNLVAKEYVAAQDEADPGVLILSRFAGAARQLNGAVIVNPYDTADIAHALRDALSMSLAERRDRWNKMIVEVRDHGIDHWRSRFVLTLQAAAEQRIMSANISARQSPACPSVATKTPYPVASGPGDTSRIGL